MITSLSCKDEFTYTNEIYAGRVNFPNVYHEFISPMSIKTELNSTTGFYEGVDSLDLNEDRIYDIIISLRLHPKDTIYKKGDRYYYPTCKFEMKNGFEVAIGAFPYNCGHGYCATADFIAALEYGKDISHFPKWSGSNTKQTLWNIILYSVSTFPGGWWSFVKSEEMYIGIKRKDKGPKSTNYTYGWIRVNAISHQKMTIAGFYME